MKKLLILSLIISAGFLKLSAQQDAEYSMYMFNGMYINPAYTGSQECVSMTALYRHQWVGIEGAPRSGTFAIHSPLKKIKIKKNMGWCDDVNSKFYNKQIEINKKISYEKLYRKDNVYDIIVVLNYNINPIIKGKGSAIFLHVAKKNYKKTQGCIALKKNELLNLISKIKKNTQVKIG